MRKKPPISAAWADRATASQAEGKLLLKLYIVGNTPKSQRALSNVKKICETYYPGGFELKVIDIYQNPEMARKDQIIAVPTLIKLGPDPFRRLIGDLSDEERVFHGLGIPRSARARNA